MSIAGDNVRKNKNDKHISLHCYASMVFGIGLFLHCNGMIAKPPPQNDINQLVAVVIESVG